MIRFGMARHLDPRPAADLRYLESGRRVRARFAGTDLADSRRALIVWEPGRPVPLYAFPREDVRSELLQPSEAAAQRAHPVAGTWSVAHAGRLAEAAAWSYDDPDLADHLALDWSAMDAWFEEDDEVFIHPRDPFHRVDVRASSRRVVVSVGGSVLAECDRPLLLFETGLPTRYYLAGDDVRWDLLEPSARRTGCPYKGQAVYWSARVGDRFLDDLAWSYLDPIPELPRIRGRVAFFNERVDFYVDGERQERPRTPWSRDDEE
jgi:uncharacterized protein (DUF427 family)